MRTIRLSDPCSTCLLRKHPTKTHGSKDARFLVVCKPPAKTASIRKAGNLTTSSMQLFSKYMRKAGFKKSDFVFTNSIKCGYDPTTFRAKDRKIIESSCREYLLRLIDRMEPEVIIPMGADAAKAVYGRNVKISKIRGVPERSIPHNTMVLPIMDPSFVHIYPQHRDIFASDCKSLKRLVDHDYDVEAAEQEVLGEYKQIYDLQFLVDSQPEVLAFDLETLGTRWQERQNAIMTMQFCTTPGEGYLLSWDHPDDPAPSRMKAKIREQLKQLLQNPNTSVIGQNAKYDRVWIQHRLGFDYRIDHDTIMIASELDENMQSKSLDTLTKIYAEDMGGYADSFNSKYDKGRMDLVPLQAIIGYGVGDVDATLRVFYKTVDELYQDEKLWKHYRRVAMPGINAFASVELRGMGIDYEALERLRIELTKYVDGLRKKLLKKVATSIKVKHAKDGISFSRKAFLLDILFYHEDGLRLKPKVFTTATKNLKPEYQVPSCSTKDHLPYFFEESDFVIDLAEYIKTERLLGTNVVGFRDKYVTDGKVYPTYQLWQAVTGRTSSKDPNGQNYPKRGTFAKKYREIFVPPEGHVILEADLSQAELRIVAELSNDRTMLRIYREGGDIHKATACIIMGVTAEEFELLPKSVQKLARFKAKAVNFGFVYGMGWRKFIVYAKTQYGVEFTEKEARRIRAAHFRLYSSLPGWHNKVLEFARERGYVRSYSGRIRHLPMVWSPEEWIAAEAGRQGINSPVQNFASDLGVMAMARLDREIDPEYLAVTGFVHDAIYALVPEQYLEWGAKTLKHYMESNPLEEWFDLKLRVPIVADVGFGWDGGNTYEMSDLSINEPFDFLALEDSYEVDFDLEEQKIPPNDGKTEIREYIEIHVD